MKKQLQKFMAALALLLFMVPAMVTWGQSEVLSYTLQPAAGSNNNYASACDITINNIIWNLTGNSTFIPWRIGGKSLNGVNRALYSKNAIPENISKIEVTHGEANGITVNSWTVIVALDASFNNVVSTLTPTFAANTTTTINRPVGADWSNCYYKFVYNVKVTNNSNKFVEFIQAKFYKEAGGDTPQPTTYTVTLVDDNTTLTQSSSGSSVTLPSRSSIGDYTFAGWSGTNVPTETTTAPTTIIPAGSYIPTNDITLYPVYTRTENGESTTEWRLTELNNVTAGVYALLTKDGHAFNGNISNGHGQVTTDAFSFTNNVATTTPTGVCEITFESASGGFKMYNANNGYLYASAASSGKLAWHNSESSYWSYASSNWKYNSNNAYLRSYNNNSIRTYGQNNGDVLKLAKKVEVSNSITYYWSTPSVSEDPSIVASNVEIAYDATSGNIAYTINHEPTPAGTLMANTTANWLTLGTVTSSEVPFTCTANDEYEPRTASVTLTYTYNTTETVTKTITVTQAANPNSPGTQNNPYTVAQARAAIDAETGIQGVYAVGIVSQIVTEYSTQYSNITFDMVDEEGASVSLRAYRCVGDDAENVTVGDVAVVYGNLTKYQSTYEFAQGCTLVSLTHNTTIIADDVTIADDATSGSITYTINNPQANGTMSVTTTSDWLTLGNNSDSPIAFTCSANTSFTARTATITLTYTYNNGNDSKIKVVTVTQNGNMYDNISDITGVGSNYSVRGTVVATNNKGFVMGDGTGYVYYYKNDAVTQSVGDMVAVSGTTGSYGHIIQFTNAATVSEAMTSNYNNTPVATVITEVPDYTEGYHLSTYLQFEGELTKSNNNYFITLGEDQIQISYPTTTQGTDLTALDGHTVLVKGYFTGINNSSKFTVMLESVEEVVVPSVTVTPATINAPFAGAEGTLALTYENIEEFISFDYYFCDDEGEELEDTDPNYPDWIVAEIQDNDDTYSLEYIIVENWEAARTAYFKVYTYVENGDDLEEVYAIVTVNQEEYVAPTYAALPFSFNGVRDDIETTDGLYQDGLGTDYNATTNPNTQLKFDGTGDWLVLQFSERPGTLTFDIKGNSFSGGTFTVQTSEDGDTYSDLATYTELGDADTKTFDNLGENVRYIKWIYTNKATGNVGLGNIALAEYVAPIPSITVNPSTINVDAEEHDGTLGITYANLTIADMTDFGVQYYDAQGEETTIPDWIEILVAEQDPQIGEGYVVSYYMIENEGEARTAYFKVFAAGDEDFVYSNLVTINQAAPVVPPTPGNWVLTDLADLTEDDVFVIVGTYEDMEHDSYAMSNDNGASTAPEAVSVTIVDNTLSEEPDANIQWNLGITDDSYIFYPNGTTDTWLYCTNTNNGVRVGTNDNKVFYINSESGYLVNDATSRYIGIYNTQDWRCYTSINSNIENQTFAFYKKVVASVQYTVTLNAGNGTCAKDTMYRSSTFELPTATSSCEAYTLAGWASSLVGTTESAPVNMYTGTYTPTEDAVLYAVYTNGTEWSSYPTCEANTMTIPYFNDFEDEAPDYVPGSYGNGRTYTKPAGWTIVSQTPPTTRRAIPQVFYEQSYAHSGYFSLRLDSSAVTAMPMLPDNVDVSQLKMELYVRQPYVEPYLEIGVMTDLSNPNSFTSVKTISTAPSTMEHWFVEFSNYENVVGEHHYIVFKNIGEDNRSINQIDDIKIYIEDACEIQTTDLPYMENFDGITEETTERTGVQPECWVVAHQYVRLSSTSKPQLFHARTYATSGDYTLRMEGRCIYAMPKLSDEIDISSLQMELNVRQPYSSQQLEVGVMSDINDANTFVPVYVINTTPSTMEHFTINFNRAEIQNEISGSHYIAFRNSMVDGNTGDKSISLIDDITLSLISNENTEPETEVAQNQSANTENTEFDNNSANSEEPFNAPNAISNFNAAQLSLYPNPTSGKVTLVADEVTMVEVYSQIGSKVATFTMNNERVIDLGNLPKGVYILRVTMPQGVAIRKVVKN
jgi:hypothetical protein